MDELYGAGTACRGPGASAFRRAETETQAGGDRASGSASGRRSGGASARPSAASGPGGDDPRHYQNGRDFSEPQQLTEHRD